MKVLRFTYLLLAILMPSLLQAASPLADAGDDITIADYDGDESVTVVLDASGTTDVDGDIVSYEWTWAGGSASGEVTEGTFPATDAAVIVTLTVTDGAGNVDTDTLIVTAYKKESALFTEFQSEDYQGVSGASSDYRVFVTIEGDTLVIDPRGTTAPPEVYRRVGGVWTPSTFTDSVTDLRAVGPDQLLSGNFIQGTNFKKHDFVGGTWVASTISGSTGSVRDHSSYGYDGGSFVTIDSLGDFYASNSGRAFAYDTSTNPWTQQELFPGDPPASPVADQRWGNGQAVSGDLLAISDLDTTTGNTISLFEKTGSSWSLIDTFAPPIASGFSQSYFMRQLGASTDVIVAQRNSPYAPIVLEDSGSGWVQTVLEMNPNVPDFTFYSDFHVDDDGDAFVAYDINGNHILYEKDDSALEWNATTVSQRALLVSDLFPGDDLVTTDFSNGLIAVCDAIGGIIRIFDKTTDFDTINAEPLADAGSDIETTSFDGQPVTIFLSAANSFDLNVDDALTAEWTWEGGAATGLQTFASVDPSVTTITLTLKDGRGGVSTDSLIVDIESPPVVDPGAAVVVADADGDDIIQLKVNATVISQDAPIVAYNWRWPGGTYSGQSGILTLGPQVDGNSVILETIDANGLASQSEFPFSLLSLNPEPFMVEAFDSSVGEEFGNEVSISDGVALVGAIRNRSGVINLSNAYLSTFINGVWNQVPLEPRSELGHAVQIDGDFAFVGAAFDEDGSFPDCSGRVYVFEKQGNNWVHFQTLGASDMSNQFREAGLFGISLSRDGDSLVVGAPATDTSADFTSRHGAAFVFEFFAGSWNQVQTILHPDSLYNTDFGDTVAISGDSIAISSPSGHDPSGTNPFGSQSAVFLFQKTGLAFDFALKLLADVPRSAIARNQVSNEGNYFGVDLAMNEGELFIGDSIEGEVYQVTKTAGTWAANGKFGSGFRFGKSLSLENNVLVVGTYLENSLSVYHLTGGNVTLVDTITGPDPSGPAFSEDFGYDVDHDGKDLIVGAPLSHNADNDETGLAFIYRNYAALNPNANYEPVADAGADINVSDTITRDTVDPFPITEPLGSEPVVLDASGSTDNEDGIASYEWSWVGGSASGVQASARFPVGTTAVMLTVTDDRGIVNTDTVDITVSLAQSNPTALPDVSGNSLTVDLPVSGALWRLSSEFLWHADNASINNIELGETYQLEILGFAGSTETITTFVTIDSANTVSTLNVTLPIQPTTTGTIRFPETEQGFSWRLAGESTWRDVADNGDEVEDLIAFSVPTGPIRIEFKPVLGYATPQTRILNISSSLTLGLNWGEYLRINNFDSSKTFDLVSSPNLGADPFQYIGMIRTPLGRGTGTVVADRVVLTAAHLFFDFNGLQWSDVQWFPRQQEGTRQAAPVLPRGILYRTSYAKLVAPDSVEGAVANLPEDDQEVDYAVLYFSGEGTWEGGSANFLQSTAERNWLTGSEAKHATGYPQRSQPYPDRGKIFEKTFSAALSPLDSKALPLLYESSEVFGDGGGSGSALFVQPQGGSQFYPAALLLAGQGRGVYHVIDSDVTRMIKDGEDAASGNDEVLDNNSSLVTYQNLGGLTTLSVDISPGAVLSNARWAVTPNAGTGFANLLPAQQVPFNPAWDSFTISFTAVSGFATPDPVFLLNSQITPAINNEVGGMYEPLSGFDDWLQANSIADPLDDGDGDRRVALLEYATDGSPDTVDFLEVVRVVETPSGEFAQYEVYVSSEADAILYEVKAVSDLADRSDPSKIELLATFDRSFGTGYQTVTDSKSYAESNSRFVWVEITHDRSTSSQ